MDRAAPVAGPPRFADELRATAKLAWPLILAQASVMMMAVVDTAVVGHYSRLELGAVSLGNALTFAFLVFGMGFAMSLEPLVAQSLGAGQPGRAWAWWRVGLRVAIIAAIPLSVLAVASSWATELFGVETALRERATAYLIARTPAMLVYLVYMAARSLLQSYQRTRPLVVAAVVANVFNLIADIVLVGGDATLVKLGLPALGIPAYGAVGAGVATSVSTIVMAVMLLVAIRGIRPTDVDEGDTSGITSGALVRIGLPLGLQLATEFIVFSSVGVMAATIDDVSAGAHQIALHCSTMTFMVSVGIGGAASARVGHSVGRDGGVSVRRAGAAAMLLSWIFMTLTAIAFLTLADPLAAVFAPDEHAVRALAGRLIIIAGIFQVFDGLQVVAAGALRGAGDVTRPFIITAVGYWGVGFPTAVLLAFEADLGARGLWFGLTAGLATTAVALAIRFWRLSGRSFARLGG
ncbi:MAG: MATE family efflux transporter [Deltaproteobacteria bacterium]|nr:MAG: MATE family efflux transporter [Deltaproteobacteria bacterium]